MCDRYSKWRRLHEAGADTTALLANHISHPPREMTRMLAYSLTKTMPA